MRALVTGTSSGIGLATALHLAQQGYQVFAGMRNPAKAEALEQQANDKQLDIAVVEMDVTQTTSVDQVFERVHAGGPLDVLVNNAGLGAATPLELTPIDEHQLIFETNYFGAIRCIQAALPNMRARGAGAIVNITSVEGLVAFPNQIAYSASKWALECAGEALAHEVKKFGIRVFNIEPGVIMTSIFKNAKPYTRFDRESPYRNIMRRNGKFFGAGHRLGTGPAEVAEVVLQALQSDSYQLRWLVGADAEKLMSGRRAMTDEEWIGLGDDLTDDDYTAEFERHFDIKL
tara:strand:+ start:590 stop:1453 length:864 start_codon:yes stop_codon:yes gene_type:complete